MGAAIAWLEWWVGTWRVMVGEQEARQVGGEYQEAIFITAFREKRPLFTMIGSDSNKSSG